MLLVVALMAVAMTLPPVVMATSAGQLSLTNENLYWNAAYEAAEAGVNDYIQHLDANGSFTQWSSGRTSPCPPSTINADDPAFCGWVPLAGQPPEWFEYSEPSTAGGGLTLTVSGKSGTGAQAVVRTFSYRIEPQNTFLDDIYWTNYESFSPSLASDFGINCGAAYYPDQPQDCWIQFASQDVLNGPVFSNDTFKICGSPTFNGPVRSAAGSRGEPLYVAGSYCGTPTPTGAGWPAINGPDEPLPTTAAEAVAAANVGCYIAGASASKPADVTMTLAAGGATTQISWSGGTVYNNAANHNDCSSPVTISALTSGLVYVLGNVTITAGSTDAGFTTIVAGASDSAGGSFGASQAGTMTLNGDVTYPPGDLQPSGAYYEADTLDGLGLIADYTVQMLTPGGNEPCPSGDETIDAAILALQNSFYNPNYQYGQVCKLTVVGSIAQAYRGVVALGGSNGDTVSGYEKDYVWDSSFALLWPPYYLSPTSATWAPESYAEERPGCAGRALGSVAC